MNKTSFCKTCGSPLQPGSRFCSTCRAPVVVSYKKRKWPLLVGAGVLVLTLLIVAALSAKDTDSSALVTGTLELGTPEQLVSQNVPAEGSAVVIDNSASELSGLSISVPSGAYSEPTEFVISEASIESHTFGSLLNPITPLIRIDNGHGFAAVAMTIRIPINLDKDEFAMAFYYDRTTGTLEGIPCLAQDTSSITIVTSHFSELLVTKADYAELDRLVSAGPVDSGFLPGNDDFFAENNGSYAAPNGHCAGQSIAALSLYKSDYSKGVHLRDEPTIDNSVFDATPAFYYDDALAYRLCSKLQDIYASNWANACDLMRNVDEELTYYSFLYAIRLTGRPQYVNINTANFSGGHALIVYKVTRDALWISDPNCPGDRTRKIDATRTLDIEEQRERVILGTYDGKQNAEDTSRIYTWIAYYGVNALIDKTVVEQKWQLVLSGTDAAADVFPRELPIAVAAGKDDTGTVIPTVLVRGQSITVSEPQLGAIDAANPTTLYIAPAEKRPGQMLMFYRGTEYLGNSENAFTLNNLWYAIELKPGSNDIGVRFLMKDTAGDYNYVDFYRFTIVLGAAETAQASAETYFGQWKLTDLKITGQSGMSAELHDEIVFNKNDPDKWVSLYIRDYSSIFRNSENLDGSTFYHAEIGIGAPPKNSQPSWTGKYFFQTNTNSYIGDFNVIIDGVKQNNRNNTLEATLLGDGTLHVVGYDGQNGLGADDMYTDLILTKTDDKTIQGTGTTIINAHSGGMITVNVTFTMTRTNKNPGLKPEYGN